MKVWDVKSRRVTFEFAGRGAAVFCVAWHPDGRQIASSGWVRKGLIVKVWDARTGQVGFEIPFGMETYAVAFSPYGDHLVTGNASGTVRVWDARTGDKVGNGKFGTHDRQVLGVVFSLYGRRLASASADGEIRIPEISWAPPPRASSRQNPDPRGVRNRASSSSFASPDG